MIDRLADAEFPRRGASIARTLLELSDPGSGPVADNLVTNEDSFARVARQLQRALDPRSAYVGVGPDQNLTLIAHARPRVSVVVDFRRRNALVHLLHKALVTLAPTRLEYLARLLARPPRPTLGDPSPLGLVRAFDGVSLDRDRLACEVVAVADTLRPVALPLDPVADLPEIAKIQAKIAGPGLNARFLALPMYPTLGQLIGSADRLGTPAHFLGTETLYRGVRDAHRGDRILPIVGDFAEGNCLPRLADWLKARDLRVATFYASDVEFFLVRSGRYPRFAANLARLPWAENALIVRTSTREIPHPERVEGDSATTIARPAAPFLESLKRNPSPTLEQLFE